MAAAKLLVGLLAALGFGWVHHGPLGRGEALIERLERQAEAELRRAGQPGIEVRFGRDVLRREAILSGSVVDFQRQEEGAFAALERRIASVPGIASVRWEPPAVCCAAPG